MYKNYPSVNIPGIDQNFQVSSALHSCNTAMDFPPATSSSSLTCTSAICRRAGAFFGIIAIELLSLADQPSLEEQVAIIAGRDLAIGETKNAHNLL